MHIGRIQKREKKKEKKLRNYIVMRERPKKSMTSARDRERENGERSIDGVEWMSGMDGWIDMQQM